MTRSRAKPDGAPGDLAPEHYAQRATLGLLITDGTQPSEALNDDPTIEAARWILSSS
jgi:2,4-dienoyl-CoA reductase-like NADH-dependent reductase (Old Yellow Enzyme family)